MVENILIFIAHTQNFLGKILELSKTSKFSNLSGYSLLSEQIEFMIGDFNAYSLLIKNLLKNFEGINDYNIIDKATCKYLKPFELFKNVEIEDDLLIIEKKIISYFQDLIFVNSKGPAKSLILPYFFTRGMLTQSLIKNITNLFAGAISKGLKELEDQKLIEVSPLKRNEKGKKIPRIYRLRSISLAVIYRLYKVF
ncbi:MAG: hypothetical protein ACTSWC_10605 [Promethearchaeota archaeon]